MQPQVIFDKAMIAHVANQKLLEAQERVENTRMIYMLSIAQDKDESGKLTYTNDLQRKSALNVELDHDEEYKELLANLKECEYNAAFANADVEMARNIFQLELANNKAETWIIKPAAKPKFTDSSLDS